MSVIVTVRSRNGYPGGNEPEAMIVISNTNEYTSDVTHDRGFYGNMGYETAVTKARKLSRVLNAELRIEPMGKFLSELER